MTSGRGYGGGVEERTGVCHGGAYPCIVGEDLADKLGDLAQAGRAELSCVGFELTGLVPIDELQGEGNVTAVFHEVGGFGAVAYGQLGVFCAFCDNRQLAHGADEGTGDGIASW